MPVITITGLIGSGAPEIGAEVSTKLGIEYVDRVILAEAAKKMGTTVAAVAERTERPHTLGDKVAGFVRTVLERSALSGGGADPYFGGGLDALLVREYRDFPPEGSSPDDSLSDSRLLEVTTGVIQELAASGNVVMAGRGANIILRDTPDSLHVGLISSLQERVQRIIDRESLDQREAEKFVAENDKARTGYFQRFFKVQPEDPHHYHLLVNVDLLGVARAAEVIMSASPSAGGA
ncbi:MAG: cytidylate kinase-like family protein [Dehalococcoidia bacterium]